MVVFVGFCCDLESHWHLIFMKANDQLPKWFQDDDALERAINGEYVFGPLYNLLHIPNCTFWYMLCLFFLLYCRWILLPCGDEAGLLKPISLSQDEKKPCIVGYSYNHADLTF